jgi:hypothetical protein
MTQYLFDPPLWLLAALFAAGLTIFWVGNKRLDKTMKWVGLAVLLADVALAVTGYLVDTPAEIVTRQTRQFVQAVVKRDPKTIDALLAPQAQVGIWSKQDIVEGAKDYADRFGLKGAHVTGIEADDHRPQMSTNFVVFSDHDSPTISSTVRTGWQFDWAQQPDGSWRILRITYVPMKEQDPTAVASQYFNRKPR